LLGIALKKMFKMILMIRMIIMNLSFLSKFLREILPIRVKKIININIHDNKIRLLIIKIKTVSNIRKIIFEIGFSLCINEFPGKNANVNSL
jgi:hypothetical protein